MAGEPHHVFKRAVVQQQAQVIVHLKEATTPFRQLAALVLLEQSTFERHRRVRLHVAVTRVAGVLTCGR